jgi:hypothetical protein
MTQGASAAHSDGTVKPDHFAFEHAVVDDVTDQISVFSRLAQPRRVRYLMSQGGEGFLGQRR